MNDSIKNIIDNLLPEIIAVRHQLHSYPELGFEEHATAKTIAKVLYRFGYEVKEQVGKTGVVALLDTRKPGKTIGLRADFDALPLQEANNFAYKSRQAGKMHACGHDGHTAILLCVAGALAQMKDQFSGKVKFIFQPAEELGDGALAMINDDVLSDPKLDAIYGLHNVPKYPLGQVVVKDGCLLAGMDIFDIELVGEAGHGAIPEICNNPIPIASHLMVRLEKILEQLQVEDPLAKLNFTKINSGYSHSFTPQKASLTCIARMSTSAMQTKLKKLIKEELNSVTEGTKIQYQCYFKHTTPPLVNSKLEAKRIYKVAQNCLGKGQAVWFERPLHAYDDFAFFTCKIPGCYFLIGNGEDSEMVHTDNYDFNDKLIPYAARVFIETVMSYDIFNCAS